MIKSSLGFKAENIKTILKMKKSQLEKYFNDTAPLFLTLFLSPVLSLPLFPDLTLLLCHRGIANLLNANEVGMKIFEDYANSWDWILM